MWREGGPTRLRTAFVFCPHRTRVVTSVMIARVLPSIDNPLPTPHSSGRMQVVLTVSEGEYLVCHRSRRQTACRAVRCAGVCGFILLLIRMCRTPPPIHRKLCSLFALQLPYSFYFYPPLLRLFIGPRPLRILVVSPTPCSLPRTPSPVFLSEFARSPRPYAAVADSRPYPIQVCTRSMLSLFPHK